MCLLRKAGCDEAKHNQWELWASTNLVCLMQKHVPHFIPMVRWKPKLSTIFRDRHATSRSLLEYRPDILETINSKRDYGRIYILQQNNSNEMSHPVTVKGKSVVRIQSSLLFQLPYHIGPCHHNFIVQIIMEMFYLCQGWGHKWEMHPLLITAIAGGRSPLIFPLSLLMIIKPDSHTSPRQNPAILWCLQRFATPMHCEKTTRNSVHLKFVLLAIPKNWNGSIYQNTVGNLCRYGFNINHLKITKFHATYYDYSCPLINTGWMISWFKCYLKSRYIGPQG